MYQLGRLTHTERLSAFIGAPGGGGAVSALVPAHTSVGSGHLDLDPTCLLEVLKVIDELVELAQICDPLPAQAELSAFYLAEPPQEEDLLIGHGRPLRTARWNTGTWSACPRTLGHRRPEQRTP
jgi:hypothetical protein